MNSNTRLIAVSLLISSSIAAGHETDQYTVPVGRRYADVGPLFTRHVYDRMVVGVAKTNARIEQAMRRGAPPEELERLRSPRVVAGAVHAQFPSFVHYIDDLERIVHSPAVVAQYPGLLVAHRPLNWVYAAGFFLDFRQVYKLWGSSTITINNVHLGTDKIGHFVHNGYFYYVEYHNALARGATEAEALQAAIRVGAGDDFFRSERQLLGFLTSGVFSNADLAANYTGLMFFRQLTEDITIGNHGHQSILIREKGLWQIQPHVTAESDFFTCLVTEHWDEVLNPNMYGLGMNDPIRNAIAERCETILQWYSDANGVVRDRTYFEAKWEEMRTLFGESYGHCGTLDELVGILNVCFDTKGATSASTDVPSPTRRPPDAPKTLHELTRLPDELRVALRDAGELNARDAQGKTPLRWAVRYGQLEAVQLLLQAGANPNVADNDGETPLHDAVRLRHHDIIQTLIDRGADVDVAARYGVRPVHLATRYGSRDDLSRLIGHGADVNVTDIFGCSPLHDAALGDVAMVDALASAGANVNASDRFGNTPLHAAARAGRAPAIRVLLARGASPDTTNRAGRTPREEAESADQPVAEELLGGVATAGRHRVRKAQK